MLSSFSGCVEIDFQNVEFVVFRVVVPYGGKDCSGVVSELSGLSVPLYSFVLGSRAGSDIEKLV